MASREEMGKVIRDARKAMAMTQQDVTNATGVNNTTVSKIENGHFTGSFDIFEKVVDSVGLQFEVSKKKNTLPKWDSINDLFGEDD